MKQNLKVPQEWYLDVCKFLELFDAFVQTRDESFMESMGEMSVRLRRVIAERSEAQQRRQWYSEYKGCEEQSIRENARQKYLDAVGMRESFRWGPEDTA